MDTQFRDTSLKIITLFLPNSRST